MRVLAAEIEATNGAVDWRSRSMRDLSSVELARTRGFLRQRFSVASPITAEAVVRLGRTPHPSRGLAEADRALARSLLDEVGLGSFAERLYASLSGGEQQRVHLARVLAQLSPGRDSPLLLLDEPSASLDPRHQHHVLSLARGRARAGWHVVAVLHDIGLAARYADAILVLDRGRVARHCEAAALDSATVASVFDVDAETWTGSDGVARWSLQPRAARAVDRRTELKKMKVTFK
jgi:iron complex transport system ATP-binding protein